MVAGSMLKGYKLKIEMNPEEDTSVSFLVKIVTRTKDSPV
jgi:hypothetical protein